MEDTVLRYKTAKEWLRETGSLRSGFLKEQNSAFPVQRTNKVAMENALLFLQGQLS
jgi:hypothetical protein